MMVGMGLLLPFLAQAADFEIAATRKKTGSVGLKPVQSGNITEGSETYTYDIKVTSRAFKGTEPVIAKYILFVERQQVGTKAELDVVERVTGEMEVEALKSRASKVFQSKPVDLKTQSLTGNWVFGDGSRVRTKDSVLGVWVKLFQGETEVGEYVNPTTLTRKHQWEE